MIKGNGGRWTDFDGQEHGTTDGVNQYTPAAGQYANWEAVPNVNSDVTKTNRACAEPGKFWVETHGLTEWECNVLCIKEAPTPTSASTSVDSCNDENGVIQMQVTLRGHSGTYAGIDPATGKGTFAIDDLEASFSDDGDWLIMEKELGGTGCTQIEVDGVNVCSQVGETITLQCRYSLAEQTIADTDFKVTGQDTATEAENTGTLEYSLVVEDNKKIGDVIKFTISPKNSGLVYATIKSCDVTRGTDRLTIIGHGDDDKCKNPVVNVESLTDYWSSQGAIEGTWTAFKWSTTADNNVETQGLSCKIALSQAIDSSDIQECEAEN